MNLPRGWAAPPDQRSVLGTVALVIAALAIVISIAGIVLAALALGRDEAQGSKGSHSVPVVSSVR
ncbi:hypothetical protein [Asanoa iriomotensis]|uniref:Uncharacterized protein n=1 Tax=Asanoa iriomotensis TaxID=234613 RepID=A0ABQ4C6B0_9ACTN|nr:hypothetical protein [Asanoa iriomotensis]GIF58317.1 hypothetical protein Air01nite_44120 [Asanoa iriomotensis]